jgi:hypothetical protein
MLPQSSARNTARKGAEERRRIMWVELEIVAEHQRSDNSVECCVCEDLFVVKSVIARAFSIDGERGGEAVCERCLAAGSEAVAARLRYNADWGRLIADEDEALAAEGVEMPNLEDFRLMEEIAAL